jgi:hypothetical protein
MRKQAALLMVVNPSTMALLERLCQGVKGIETNADHPPFRQRMMPETV